MRIKFSKYQGAGNDFILVNDFDKTFPGNDHELIKLLCDRRFGIGADGLMLLQKSKDKYFDMVYYNSDGHEGTMCGNGGRCLVAFARRMGVINKNDDIVFNAVDGEHGANIERPGYVSLQMKNVSGIQRMGEGYGLDTGSIHHVEYVDNLVDFDVYRRGKAIREHKMYAPAGCNVNFIHVENDTSISIRTYERGVEAETLACGTGSVASAIVHHSLSGKGEQFKINARGGKLQVSFDYEDGTYKNIWLSGPATFVFNGEWNNE